MIKFVNKDLRPIEKLEKETDMTIEEALRQAYPVPIYEEYDGVSNLLSVCVHYGGFMISIDGDNHSKTDIAYVSTFIDFKILEDMKKAMDEHKHLIDEDLYT